MIVGSGGGGGGGSSQAKEGRKKNKGKVMSAFVVGPTLHSTLYTTHPNIPHFALHCSIAAYDSTHFNVGLGAFVGHTPTLSPFFIN